MERKRIRKRYFDKFAMQRGERTPGDFAPFQLSIFRESILVYQGRKSKSNDRWTPVQLEQLARTDGDRDAAADDTLKTQLLWHIKEPYQSVGIFSIGQLFRWVGKEIQKGGFMYLFSFFSSLGSDVVMVLMQAHLPARTTISNSWWEPAEKLG
ncbi:hypothetical protein L218DRAFT_991934 [Marasmius fiardii PR-910]|nr:hypothetical protein L218DRAFT_991934 [Marasmius fiardii PR-910]